MKLTSKEISTFYAAKSNPIIISIPRFKYFTMTGQGDPNQPDFALAVEALYTLTYAIKMSYKKDNPPIGYYAYKVFPLEGVWDLVDKSKPSTDKSNYAYKLMIQQPDFVDENVFFTYLDLIKKKKQNPKLSLLKYEEIEEGLCCQMCHLGPFDTEAESFRKMEYFCHHNGYVRISKTHKEIYLSDPRRSGPDKLKTILRFAVASAVK